MLDNDLITCTIMQNIQEEHISDRFPLVSTSMQIQMQVFIPLTLEFQYLLHVLLKYFTDCSIAHNIICELFWEGRTYAHPHRH